MRKGDILIRIRITLRGKVFDFGGKFLFRVTGRVGGNIINMELCNIALDGSNMAMARKELTKEHGALLRRVIWFVWLFYDGLWHIAVSLSWGFCCFVFTWTVARVTGVALAPKSTSESTSVVTGIIVIGVIALTREIASSTLKAGVLTWNRIAIWFWGSCIVTRRER